MRQRPWSILIVEDERIVAADLKDTLAEMGYEVVAIAPSAEEALIRAARQRPDLVLMDIRIEGELDGIAAAELLRARHGVAVIYLTAHADLRTLERAKRSEPLGYLLKPVQAADLRIAIEMAQSRHRMEQRLRESEERFRLAMEEAPIGMALVGADGKLSRVNRALCAILGYPASELAALTFEALTHPGDAGLQAALAARLTEGELASYQLEKRFVHQQGRTIDALVSASMVRSGGEPLHSIVQVQDVSAEKAAQQARDALRQQLQLSERLSAVGTLAAGIAHEINNPLATVSTNLEMVLADLYDIAGPSPPARLRELIRMVDDSRQGADRIRQIVRGLRTLTRGDDEEPVRLDVRAVLDWSISLAAHELRQRARLVKEYAAVPAVLADETRLGQVFINLLVNAASAIPAGHPGKHQIRVVTRTDGGRAVIEVHDSGRGMTAEVARRVFEPFFTTRDVGEGTGLGLSICHGLVSSMGGTIAVESQPGQGSIFRVVLPPAVAV